MRNTLKKVNLSFIMILLFMLITTKASAASIKVFYGSNELLFVEAILTRTGEGAQALTQNNNGSLVNVSLSITSYELEDRLNVISQNNGNSGYGGTSVSLSAPHGFYCIKADSTHLCSYFGFYESLTE